MKNNENLKKNIIQFIDERIEEIYKNLANDMEYRKISKQYFDYYDKIEMLINNENLTDNYKTIELDIHRIELQKAYKTGFKDSFMIHNNNFI